MERQTTLDKVKEILAENLPRNWKLRELNRLQAETERRLNESQHAIKRLTEVAPDKEAFIAMHQNDLSLSKRELEAIQAAMNEAESPTTGEQ